MNAKTLEALNSSIAHWERMAAGKPNPDEAPDADSCALCCLFIEDDCIACPVALKTGFRKCRNTPFKQAALEWNKGCWMPTLKFRSAAKEELAFLQSLLPKAKR